MILYIKKYYIATRLLWGRGKWGKVMTRVKIFFDLPALIYRWRHLINNKS